jgi:hypothetical protein
VANGLLHCGISVVLTARFRSARGHKRPFASVEPHASFTLTNRHPQRQSARPTVKVAQQGDRAGKECITAAESRRFFWKSVLEKFRMGAGANLHLFRRDMVEPGERLVAEQWLMVRLQLAQFFEHFL